MYFLSKLLPLFIYPVGLVILFWVFAGILIAIGRKNSAILTASLGMFILWVCATPVFSNFIIGSLEQRFPPIDIKVLPQADAVVILGGSSGGNENIPNIGIHADRFFHGFDIYETKQIPLIILSGGSSTSCTPEAIIMGERLRKLGVDNNNIIEEADSRNTYEQALNCSIIFRKLDIDNIILVTSAMHMRRALTAFNIFDVDTAVRSVSG